MMPLRISLLLFILQYLIPYAFSDDSSRLRRVASCISNYADLVAAFANAAGQDSPSFLLCAGTITVKKTLLLKASGASLSCADTAQSCILEKDSTIAGRILRIQGNGALISGIAFKNGQSQYGGGAVLITGTDGFGSVTIQDCAFIGNSAGRDGGALKVTRHGCVVKVIDSRFISNKATSFGGAVSILENYMMCRSVSSSRKLISCPLEVSGTYFQSNLAGYGGGAVSFFIIMLLQLASRVRSSLFPPSVINLFLHIYILLFYHKGSF